jgi:hypothetical protein
MFVQLVCILRDGQIYVYIIIYFNKISSTGTLFKALKTYLKVCLRLLCEHTDHKNLYHYLKRFTMRVKINRPSKSNNIEEAVKALMHYLSFSLSSATDIVRTSTQAQIDFLPVVASTIHYLAYFSIGNVENTPIEFLIDSAESTLHDRIAKVFGHKNFDAGREYIPTTIDSTGFSSEYPVSLQKIQTAYDFRTNQELRKIITQDFLNKILNGSGLADKLEFRISMLIEEYELTTLAGRQRDQEEKRAAARERMQIQSFKKAERESPEQETRPAEIKALQHFLDFSVKHAEELTKNLSAKEKDLVPAVACFLDSALNTTTKEFIKVWQGSFGFVTLLEFGRHQITRNLRHSVMNVTSLLTTIPAIAADFPKAVAVLQNSSLSKQVLNFQFVDKVLLTVGMEEEIDSRVLIEIHNFNQVIGPTNVRYIPLYQGPELNPKQPELADFSNMYVRHSPIGISTHTRNIILNMNTSTTPIWMWGLGILPVAMCVLALLNNRANSYGYMLKECKTLLGKISIFSRHAESQSYTAQEEGQIATLVPPRLGK